MPRQKKRNTHNISRKFNTEFHRNKKTISEEIQRGTIEKYKKLLEQIQQGFIEKYKKISGANTIGNVRVGATRPQLTFLPTPQLNCALHQKQIRVDESTTNGKAENIILLDVYRIYLLLTLFIMILISREKNTQYQYCIRIYKILQN